jgi:hypothetical protein
LLTFDVREDVVMATLIGAIAAAIVAAGAAVALWPLVRTYRRYRGTRVILCPESGEPAAVEVDATLAAATQASTGKPLLQLATCSRWPERQGCGQECLAQIEAAPEDCLARTMLARWYEGKRCVFCHHEIGAIHWMDHRPSLRNPQGATVDLADVRPEELPRVLSSHAPVCWNCHIAETFRRQHPELVVDDPPPPRQAHAG